LTGKGLGQRGRGEGGVLEFFLPLPFPSGPFFSLNAYSLRSGNISSPQSSTVAKYKMAPNTKICALARPKYACTAG